MMHPAAIPPPWGAPQCANQYASGRGANLFKIERKPASHTSCLNEAAVSDAIPQIDGERRKRESGHLC